MFKILNKFVSGISSIKRGKTSAIILCAGSSTRFSSENENKIFAPVLGVPVILRTINAFENSDAIGEIILVTKKECVDELKSLVCDNGIKKVSCIVVGGNTRQESAFKGFKHVSEKAKLVAIHDGARCLVTPKIIESVIIEADKYKAATAGTQVTDTVKLCNSDGFISKTIDRNFVWNVQTPQIFEKKLYCVCAHNAYSKGINATDDCMLVESAGFNIKLVETGKENIKITVKEDIRLAEYILNSRGEGI